MSRAAGAIIAVLFVCVAGLARAGILSYPSPVTWQDAMRVEMAEDTLPTAVTPPPAVLPDSLAVSPDSLPARTDSLSVQVGRLSGEPVEADTTRLFAAADSMALQLSSSPPPKMFIPKPGRALWLALVFPGAGQIYNRKFWKLPFIYGGFIGCTYALMWNQQMYLDYSQAYLDIMDDDPTTDSYMDMLPPRYDITGREQQFQTIFKNKKDYYRRYRDLSIFCFVGVYLLSVIDAYVDAQLSVFDISRDLSMRFEPAVIDNNIGGSRSKSYGIGCSLNF